MVKRDPIKDDSDTYDDTDVDMKSPTKKRKVAGKKEEPVDSSPDVKKRGKGASVNDGRAWTKDEEEDLLDCVQVVIAANLTAAIKDFPSLSARKSDGCFQHWNAMRRKLDIAVLGAPTILHNGKKIEKANRVKQDDAKSE